MVYAKANAALLQKAIDGGVDPITVVLDDGTSGPPNKKETNGQIITSLLLPYCASLHFLHIRTSTSAKISQQLLEQSAVVAQNPPSKIKCASGGQMLL